MHQSSRAAAEVLLRLYYPLHPGGPGSDFCCGFYSGGCDVCPCPSRGHGHGRGRGRGCGCGCGSSYCSFCLHPDPCPGPSLAPYLGLCPSPGPCPDSGSCSGDGGKKKKKSLPYSPRGCCPDYYCHQWREQGAMPTRRKTRKPGRQQHYHSPPALHRSRWIETEINFLHPRKRGAQKLVRQPLQREKKPPPRISEGAVGVWSHLEDCFRRYSKCLGEESSTGGG